MGGALDFINTNIQNATGVDVTGQGAAKAGLEAQLGAANSANNLQGKIFDTTQQNLKPYMDAGSSAVNNLSGQMNSLNQPFTMSQFQQDPGYQFNLQQGQKAIQQSMAATGGLVSGNQMSALNNYSQNMASNEYGNAFNRYQQQQQNSFNRMYSLAGLGQNAAAGVGSFGQNYANQVGNNTMGAANAQAAYGQQQQGMSMSMLGTGAGLLMA